MDLSVIIPCHNLEGFIMPLLDSFAKQEFLPYQVEFIFILDTCTDKTEDVIFKWSRKCNLDVLIINTDVESCGLARNKGLAYARGKYVWFMDGDDWLIGTDAIKSAIEFIEFNESSYIRFDYDYSDTFKAYGYYSMVWQYIFSREAIGDMRFISIQPHEDRQFMDRFIKIYGSAPIMQKKLYYYNFGREGSNMQQFIAKGKIEL